MMTGLPHYRMYVDGGWRDAAESIMVHSPATGAPVATVAYGDLTAVDDAVAAARAVLWASPEAI